jgi:negative regulator of sigma E activity
MSDMTDDPRDPTDARDINVAARLETEPLDDVTRARLVRAAMAASAPEDAVPAGVGPSRWPARVRRLAVAAAVVAVAAVGLSVILRDDPDSAPTASRAESRADSKATDELRERLASPSVTNGGASADAAGAQSLRVGSGLGDLGNVGTAARLRRAIAAVAPEADTSAAATASAPSPESAQLSACATTAAARLGRVVAAGTGTVDGDPVSVFVVERSNGKRVAVVVDAACNAREPVGL